MITLYNNILFEQAVLGTSQTKPLVGAITNRHPITFMYDGPRKGRDSVLPGTRENGLPVAIGLSKKGNLIIRVFIPSSSKSKKGFSKTNWRTFMVSRMKNIKVNEKEIFNKPLGYESGDDGSMTVTYNVKPNWNGQPNQPKPEKKPTTKPTEKPTVEPTGKPQVKPVEPTVKPTEPTPIELPQPKPTKKPEPIPTTEIPPKEEPKSTEPQSTPQELPQPKSQSKPNVNPEVNPEKDEENNQLRESILRIKTLMFS